MEKRVLLRPIFALSLFLLLAISIVSASVESDFLSLINNERTKLGIPVLSYNLNLTESAYLHSKEMAENAYFSHDSMDNTPFDKRIASLGYTDFKSIAENIAYASGNADANRAFEMWKNSPPHYSNMISNSFNELGLGIYSKDGLTYYTLDLGKRTDVVSPVAENNILPYGNVLFSSVDVSQTQSRSYRFIKIKGNLNQKLAVYYYLDNKKHRVCSNCNKFSFSIRTNADKLVLNLSAVNKFGNNETKILEI